MSAHKVMLAAPAPVEDIFRQSVTNHKTGRRHLVAATVVITLAVVAIVVHYLTPFAWNVAATQALQSLSIPGLKSLMRLISGFGNAPKVILITSAALLACNRRREAVFLAWSGLGGWIITMQLKHFFSSPRPTADVVAIFHNWPTGSFPSGHLVFYVCYFGFLLVIAREKLPQGTLFRRLALILLALPIALVGFSRVFLGEHWLTDLPGSYLFGFLWLALSVKLYRLWGDARERQRRLTLSVSGYR